MKTTPWDEILRERYTPKQLAALRARARRGILVEFYPHDETPTWIGCVHGEKLSVEARGPSIGRARRNVRAALERVVGRRRAIALWRERAETMPAGAEDEEREEARRREHVPARGRARSGLKSRRAATARDAARR